MPIKILVIEDSNTLRKDIMEMLTYEGFDVRGAENGFVGITCAREYQPDLIICDIMMPEMDGYEVLSELQKDDLEATIPFIFLTARTDKGDVRLGMELGANDYLTKPFSVIELMRTVEKQLAKRQVFDRVAARKLDDLRDNIILALPHELRTPLTGILGFSDLLAEDCRRMESDQIVEMAQYIHSAALRLYRLTENYLIYAQLQLILSDPQRIQALRRYNTANPRAIIEDEAIRLAQAAQRAADISFEVAESGPLSVLEENLKKITEELLDNAFKFSEPGTPVKITGQVKDAHYVLTVTDQGRGIPPQHRRDVGAYRQFDRDLNEQQGSGFGLAIVKRLAQLHSGQLDIDSMLDKGTTITVRLPLAGLATSAQNGRHHAELS